MTADLRTRESCGDLRAGTLGRGTRTRTLGLRIWNPLLYQLSYTPAGREIGYGKP